MKKAITLTDLLLARRKREEKYFKNYLKYAELIKRESEKVLGKVKVFIFGSILRKNEVPQDIDILIISSELKTDKQKSEIRARLIKKLGTSAPFEIHLITPKEYREWYKNFIKEKIEI
ncbi:MAG TPA: nucleotidyltransferase domain-containing protein [Candidatus Hypogeohydataceae bacterium YC41]